MPSITAHIEFAHAPDEDDRDQRHVLIAERIFDHAIDGLHCKCGPTYQIPCSKCGGAGESCWACDDGWVPATREEAEHADAPVVVVHSERGR